jgi:hypothetical protein
LLLAEVVGHGGDEAGNEVDILGGREQRLAGEENDQVLSMLTNTISRRNTELELGSCRRSRRSSARGAPEHGDFGGRDINVDISVEHPGGDKEKVVLMASVVSSALTGGAPTPGQGMFLAVP